MTREHIANLPAVVPCLRVTGGYVAGKKELVRAAANRLGAPGVAGGATLGQNSNLFHVRERYSLRTLQRIFRFLGTCREYSLLRYANQTAR